MKRIKFILLAITLLLAAPAFLTSCQEDAPEINYTMNVSVINDFTKVVEAINSGFLKNEQAIQKLTEAIDKMNADQQTKLQAVIDVLTSVNATLDTKLAAIEAAMKAQTLSLEAKLDLLETAVNNQTLKQEEMAGKLTTAIESLQGSMEAKLDAITEAINDVNTTLETKLDLIEAAMRAQTLSLEGKLDLLEAAIKNQTLKQEEMAGKLTTAIESLQGSMEEKMEAIMEAINNANTTLETKLAAIEAAMKAQTLSLEAKLDLLEAAIKALPDYTSQLEAIKTAIEALPDYGDKLTALENAIKALPDYNDKFDAIVDALNAMKTEIEALGDGQTEIAGKIAEATTAINALIAEVKSGNTGAAAALAQIIQKLEELKAAIGNSGGGGTTPSTDDYVDLGLPSGVKWAKCNLGASKPSDSGDYYAWGETEPKAEYSWATYKWGTEGNLTKYNDTDGKTTLDPEDDAATAKLGSSWRMPTENEIDELLDNCTWTWTTQDGVKGYKVKSKTNGNAIFLPAAGVRTGSELNDDGRWGVYWPSSLPAYNIAIAHTLAFDSGEHISGNRYRYNGLSVRPVYKEPSTEEKYVDLGLPSGVKWAKCNLGASKPSDYGDYYAWGETEPKAEYTWTTYKWNKWMQTGQTGPDGWRYITKYTIADDQTEAIWYDTEGNFIGDGKTTLDPEDDAATVKLGLPWRMPTKNEIEELLDHCTWTWTTQDGVNGYEVKGTNGNAIFLPAAGYHGSAGLVHAGVWSLCWSSSLCTSFGWTAYHLNLSSGEHNRENSDRLFGGSVRPVRP